MRKYKWTFSKCHETPYTAQPLHRRSKYYVCLNSAIPKRKNDTTLENNGHAVSQLNTSWIPTASSCPGHEHDRRQECRYWSSNKSDLQLRSSQGDKSL